MSDIMDSKPVVKNKIKRFELIDVNEKYLEVFFNTRYPEWQTCIKQRQSWSQYKSTLSRFMQYINKDIVMITDDEIDSFLSNIKNSKTKKNKIKYIKGLLQFLLENNILSCRTRASKFVYIFTDIVPTWFFEIKEMIK